MPKFEDETLLRRIQNYVSRDINSKVPLEGSDAEFRVQPLDVYVISFQRVLNTWVIECSAESNALSFYKIIYDGDTGRAVVRIYMQHGLPQEAIL